MAKFVWLCTGTWLNQSGCNSFRVAVEKSGLTLPKGQLAHLLRHTFSSHFVMNGGNILVLQKTLGHSSLIMTMRYAHLAPDHLQEQKRPTH
ncbi:MAG: tyrosine-type recombinase/integrase [Gallionella sp.]|nr:tyrosine-type recombinase/integrase [Gallionella sp.]